MIAIDAVWEIGTPTRIAKVFKMSIGSTMTIAINPSVIEAPKLRRRVVRLEMNRSPNLGVPECVPRINPCVIPMKKYSPNSKAIRAMISPTME